jgi:hypothetical protein
MGALRDQCRALGGTLTIDSKPGAGTTLRFEFPYAAITTSKNSHRASAIPPRNSAVNSTLPTFHPN